MIDIVYRTHLKLVLQILVYLKSDMFKNSFQLTLRVYHKIPFLFLLTRVKLTSDFRSLYGQLDPVSLNFALWTN